MPAPANAANRAIELSETKNIPATAIAKAISPVIM